MEDKKIRLVALIGINISIFYILKAWIYSDPDSISQLIRGLPSG